VPAEFDPGAVKERVERAYSVEVAAVLPHSDDMMALGSAGIFGLRQPDHPLTDALRQVAANVLGPG
jgi:MinD-like ATPase involved in chromosome partitioning or flagellar assembly